MNKHPAKRRRTPRAEQRPGPATNIRSALRTKGKRISWRRTERDQSMSHELGLRVRAARERKGLSLAELSARCGIPDATLSRIENNRMSPTFGLLARVMMGLEIDWVELMGSQESLRRERVVSFAEPGVGRSADVRGSTARVLHSVEAARNLPLYLELHARNLKEAGGLIGHRGEEFCYVLAGTLLLHIEGQRPRTLCPGGSALFDSSIPHAYLAAGEEGVKILMVVNREFGFVPPEGVIEPTSPTAAPTRSARAKNALRE